MHIPDGYLSPSTCAVLYAASAPFWYISVQRLKRFLTTRLVPLISIFAAFSFVIMMFNLPLPGGTTGHATGAALAAIVLGPWGAIVAVSIALILQALFFGDGGILAIGANCFNIAILGSLVGYGLYRALAGNAPLTSQRRVVAAAVAGYLSINVAALVTAIEFGIQPMFFKDANGTPLYSFYPLSIAIPAMMIGHLGFAGLAEAIVTAGVVAYLQRSDPRLLRLTAPAAETSAVVGHEQRRSSLRPLWIGLLVLLLLSPLGLLPTGTAWGEWGTDEIVQEQIRFQMRQLGQDEQTALATELEALATGAADQTAAQQLRTSAVELREGRLDEAAEAAAGQIQLLRAADPGLYPKLAALAAAIKEPSGLQKWASFWTAPIPDYAPAFLKSEMAGYIISAVIGSLLVVVATWLIGRVLAGRSAHS